MPRQYCTEFTYVWAVGGRPNFQPPHVGIPIDSEDYILQIHLNNPSLLQDRRANIAFDIFYTEQLRQNDGGMITVQHEVPGIFLSLFVPPDTSNHQVRSLCGSECTRNMLPPEGVSVYGVLLHTHNAGRRIRLRHFRNNRELPFVVADENFSSSYQQNRNLPQELRILPGDQFVAECGYDSFHVNRTILGGFATSQEMCATHLYHYQRVVDIQLCDSEIMSPAARRYFLAGVDNITWSNDAIEYLVDPPHQLAGMPISVVSNNFIDWSRVRREALDKLHLFQPHMNRCTPERFTLPLGVTLDMFPRHEVSYPYGAKPYQPDLSCTLQLK